MTRAQCPTPAALLDFVDETLSPEQSSRITAHLPTCSACSDQVTALRTLISDVAAPLDEDERLDMNAHVASVMERLDEAAVQAPRVLPRLWLGVGAALAAAAALVLLLKDPARIVPSVAVATDHVPAIGSVALGPGASGPNVAEQAGEWVARGGAKPASLARDVGVQLYVDAPPLTALESGKNIAAGAALTAGVRNVSSTNAYLLLFAVDAQGEVHWVAPLFTVEGTDPESTPVPPGPKERLLGSAVVFEDLPPGPLTVVTLLSAKPERVSRVEGLPASERTPERLGAHFPQAFIQFLSLTVTR